MAAVYKNYNRGLGLLLWKLDKFRIPSSSIRFKHVGGISISSILQDYSIGSDVNVKGWIKSIRKQKEITFMQIGDGSTDQIQVVIPSNICNADCCFNAAVEIRGKLVPSPNAHQPVEIAGQNISVLGKLDLKSFPFSPRKSYPATYVRQHLSLRPKTQIYAAILRLSSLISTTLHTTLTDNEFVHIYTPILTSNDCEGAGEVFTVRPASDELCHQMKSNTKNNLDEAYFDKKVYLTVSGQLHLEAITGGISKVFTIGPTFRSENSRTRRHLAEFRMLEAEIAFCQDLQPLLSTMEHLTKQAATAILEHGAKDLAVVSKYNEQNIEESLNQLLKAPFATISYREAMELLMKNRHAFKQPPIDGADVASEHELFLVKHTGRPTFLVDWPAKIKPFYMRTKDEDDSLVSCVDLLVPDVGELCGGSLRENRYDLLESRLQQLKLDESLSWYLDLRKSGGSPTGGFGMGVERLISYLLKVPNVKDIVPFPRTPHHCPM